MKYLYFLLLVLVISCNSGDISTIEDSLDNTIIEGGLGYNLFSEVTLCVEDELGNDLFEKNKSYSLKNFKMIYSLDGDFDERKHYGIFGIEGDYTILDRFRDNKEVFPICYLWPKEDGTIVYSDYSYLYDFLTPYQIKDKNEHPMEGRFGLDVSPNYYIYNGDETITIFEWEKENGEIAQDTMKCKWAIEHDVYIPDLNIKVNVIKITHVYINDEQKWDIENNPTTIPFVNVLVK